jgi:WD40 repeat protein
MATYESRPIALPSDLFALAVHPTEPLLTAGLLSGHVHAYTWRAADASDSDSTTPAQDAAFSIAWKTRRHKGSCRTLGFSSDGATLYTAGTDNLLKSASTQTGRVISKALLPEADTPSTLLPLSPQHLILGTDTGDILLYDLRAPSSFAAAQPAAEWKHVHGDYISSLLSLPASSTSTTGFPRTFCATGDTTLVQLDVRKPGKVLGKSEDQEDEILCSAFVANAPSKQTGGSETVLTGTGGGVVTTWNRGFWEDHQTRVPLARTTGDSVDSLLDLPEGFEVAGLVGGWGKYFAAGSGDGKVRIVKMGQNKVVTTLAHSYSADEAKRMAGGKVKKGDYVEGLEEGVSALGIDCEGRIVSGGGLVVKLWTPKEEEEKDAAAEPEERKRRKNRSDSEEEGMNSDEVDSDSSEDEKERRKRKKKKRKGGRGKAKSTGVKNVNVFKGLD